jgi:hypothetical protein
MAEDEYARTVQVQTLSGEGVLTRWQRFLKAAGVRRWVPWGRGAPGKALVGLWIARQSFVMFNSKCTVPKLCQLPEGQ